jgi:dihydroorotase
MNRILIANAMIINENDIKHGDVLIDDGRITKVGGNLSSRPHDRLIDAAGRALLPGLIDDQVHFREPGLTHKGDIGSESRAAVAGGVTSFMDMPNTQPATTDPTTLEAKRAAASGRAYANYAFYLGATNTNIEAVKSLDPQKTCGVKIFMGASTGNMLVDDPDTLEAIFTQSPLLVATHCEDTPTILANEAQYRSRYGEAVPMRHHSAIRSREACFKSSSLAVALAKRHSTRLHILHLTTSEELQLLEPGSTDTKHITGEVCVHHLFFQASDYEVLGARIKCNPAIKLESDRRALLAALNEDRIDVIATDHAPHTLEEKQQPYFQAPAGLPLVQYALPSLLEHYHRGVLSLPRIVDKTSHAVARLFGIQERGYIREGYWADLVLVDLNRPDTVTADKVISRCGWSPFENQRFQSTVDLTMVNGGIVYENGKITGPPSGRPLEFDRR